MRLINTHEFPPKAPKDIISDRKYAILSHTWDDDEVTLADLGAPYNDHSSPSWMKIKGAQQQAAKDGWDWIWIDTLCIDKSSSAELSEAINSMYRWYQEAQVCYVYLSDISGPFRDNAWSQSERQYQMLESCRWFKRGWTLQELLAPVAVRFFDKKWNFIATLDELAVTVSKITGIHLLALQDYSRVSSDDYSIAQRLSWAAGRVTTRPEDRAYSLLGILELSLDIRYGEGARAFTRLQEELIEKSNDETILAWDERLYALKEHDGGHGLDSSSLLAPSPDEFALAHNIVPSSQTSQIYRMTNGGLQISTKIVQNQYMFLNCEYQDDPTAAIGVNVTDYGSYLDGTKSLMVVLRKASPNSITMSRLTLIDPIEVTRAANFQQVVIHRATDKTHLIMPPAIIYPLNDPIFTVWLRNSLVGDMDEFWLESSDPPAERPYRDTIWPVKAKQNFAILSSRFGLTATFKNRSGVVIRLQLNLQHGRFVDDVSVATMKFISVHDEKLGITQGSLIEVDSSTANPLPLSAFCCATWKLHVAATLQKLTLNNRRVYPLTLWVNKDVSKLRQSISKFLDETPTKI